METDPKEKILRLKTPFVTVYAHLKTFPHRYFRRLLKELAILTPLVVLALILYNLTIPKTNFEKIKSQLAIDPTNKTLHRKLAQDFLEANNLDSAHTELIHVLSLSSVNSQEEVELQKQLTEITKAKNVPEEVKEEILFWRGVVAEKSPYRDALIKLAILNWKLYRSFDVQKYLQEASLIDPNNSNVLLIRHQLSD